MNVCGDSSLKTTNVNHMVALAEKFGDHSQVSRIHPPGNMNVPTAREKVYYKYI